MRSHRQIVTPSPTTAAARAAHHVQKASPAQTTTVSSPHVSTTESRLTLTYLAETGRHVPPGGSKSSSCMGTTV